MRLRLPEVLRRKTPATKEDVANPAADAMEEQNAEPTGSSPAQLTDEEWEEFRKADPKAAQRYMALKDNDPAGKRRWVIWRRRLLRFLLLFVLLILVLRACIRPHADLSGVATQDAAGAQTFASEYVKDWYTWDESDREARGQRLSLYNPGFKSNVGWNGRGKQTVTDAAAIRTEHPEDSKYVITVRYTTTASDNPSYASVAVYDDHGNYSPLSQPSLVAPPNLPVPTRSEETRTQVSDAAELNPINDRLDVFFNAWSRGDTSTLDAVTTANGPKTALNNGTEFKELRSVTVYSPGDSDEDKNRRDARVVVSWKQPDGASTTDSTYGVVLVNEGGRWLVDSIDGGLDNPDAYVDSGATAAPAPSESATSTASPTTSPSASPTSSASPAKKGR